MLDSADAARAGQAVGLYRHPEPRALPRRNPPLDPGPARARSRSGGGGRSLHRSDRRDRERLRRDPSGAALLPRAGELGRRSRLRQGRRLCARRLLLADDRRRPPGAGRHRPRPRRGLGRRRPGGGQRAVAHPRPLPRRRRAAARLFRRPPLWPAGPGGLLRRGRQPALVHRRHRRPPGDLAGARPTLLRRLAVHPRGSDLPGTAPAGAADLRAAGHHPLGQCHVERARLRDLDVQVAPADLELRRLLRGRPSRGLPARALAQSAHARLASCARGIFRF